MVKGIKNKIILTRMDEPIDKTSLRSNECIVGKYWKVSYYGLAPKDNHRGEMQRYLENIDGINAIRGDEPKEIIISF